MQTQTLESAAKESADRLLNEPEVKGYIARVLRVAFMEGCVWAKQQQIEEMKAKLAAQQSSQSSQQPTAEVTTNAN